MPSDKKGKKMEPGIWELLEGKGYIAEVSWMEPLTGKRVRERKTTNRLDGAQKWRNNRKAEALMGEITKKKKQQVILFGDFADEYYKAWSLKCKKSTVRVEKTRINGVLKPYFGKKPIHTITRRDIEIYITRRREKGIKVSTTNRELCRLKNMLSKAVDWEHLETNPAHQVKQEREAIEEADYLTKEEVVALLKDCVDYLRPLLTVAVNTGMRRGELFSLEWRDVNLRQELITVRKPKNNETRYVPMNKDVQEVLSVHRREQAKEIDELVSLVFINPDTGKSYSNVRRAFSKSLRAAGIDRHFTFHGLRHTAASNMVMSGIDRGDVGRILGHKTPQMTRRYEHLAPEYLKGAIHKLNYSETATKNDTQKSVS